MLTFTNYESINKFRRKINKSKRVLYVCVVWIFLFPKLLCTLNFSWNFIKYFMKLPKRKELSLDQRSAIYTLNEKVYSDGTITNRLGISRKGVCYILARKTDTDQFGGWKCSGRSLPTTAAEDRFIMTTVKQDWHRTPDITQHRRIRIAVTTLIKV